jgi:hypothetical protein
VNRSIFATGILATIMTVAGPVHATRYDTGDAEIVNKVQRNGQTFYVPRYHYTGSATSAGSLGFAFRHASDAPALSRLPSQSGFAWRLMGPAADPMVSLSAGGVTLEVNRAAGCSIWGWQWNGQQFINHRDYGREMQGSLTWADSTGNSPNPTEAGDRFRNGSPCTVSVSGTTLSSTAVPLEWNGGSLRGAQGGPDRPVIWSNITISKRVSLDYGDMGAVARYDTDVTIPRALARGAVEIPTIYLGPQFNQIVTYDARSGQMVPARAARNRAENFVPRSGYGGIIAVTYGNKYAMGIYGATTSSGGSVTYFTVTDFAQGGGGSSATAAGTVKVTARYIGPLAQGRNPYTCWVMSGTLDQVKREMSALSHR